MKKRANSITLWIILLLITIMGVYLILCDIIHPSLSFIIAFAAFAVYVVLKLYWLLTHVVFLCESGIELIYYGRLHRLLPWDNICQICTAKLLPISMKVSAPTSILIVPNGCKKYNGASSIGYLYLLCHGRQVLRIDDTPGNRKVICELYGELDMQH